MRMTLCRRALSGSGVHLARRRSPAASTPVARTYSLIGSTSAVWRSALAGSRLSNVPGHLLVLDLGEDGAELWVSRRGMSH